MKLLANGIAFLLTAWFAYPVRWLAPIDGDSKLFVFFSQAMSLIPGIPGDYFRSHYHRIALGLDCKDITISFGTTLAQRGIEIGDNTYLGSFCSIGLCKLGSNVLIGSRVSVISGPNVHFFDRTDIPIREQGGELIKVVIGDDCWLGNQSIVMNNVGKGSVIGAGAVVVKPCEQYGIYVGNPARLLKRRID